MPFVNGKYVPEDSSAAEQKNLKKQQEKLEKEQKRAQKEQLQEKKRKQKAEKNKNNKPELTPEQLEELEKEKQRQIEESARRFEELISTDNPDLTNLNKLNRILKSINRLVKRHIAALKFFYLGVKL